MAQVNCPTEQQEQIAVFKWAELNSGKHPELALLFHIPNGGKRGAKEAAIFKAAGVKRGVPDLCLPVARKGYHGLYIEMKRKKGGYAQPTQIRWARDLERQGYAVALCHGWEEAAKVLEEYLNDGREIFVCSDFD